MGVAGQRERDPGVEAGREQIRLMRQQEDGPLGGHVAEGVGEDLGPLPVEAIRCLGAARRRLALEARQPDRTGDIETDGGVFQDGDAGARSARSARVGP